VPREDLFLTQRSIQLAVLALVAVGLALGSAVRSALGLEIHPEALRQRVEEFGALGPAIFVVLLSLRFVLLIPSAVMLTVGGACFGVVMGTLYGALGLTLMGLFQFVLVQWAGAEALRERVPARLQGALRAARSSLGAGTLALVAAYPVGPLTPVQLAAALAGMPFLVYAVCVAAGSLLRAGLFAWFGSALLEGEGVLLVGALLTAVLFLPLLHPRARRFVLTSFGAVERQG
jgi:uncharacterized membrane protein YdjX (TVP38/TMEM64 family)